MARVVAETDGLEEIKFADIKIGDVITVSFANAGRRYVRFGQVGYISPSGIVREAGPEKFPTSGEHLIAKSQYSSKYDYDIHVFRGLPRVREPLGFGAVVRARPPHFPPGKFAYYMRTPNIDPKTYVMNQVWMQLSNKPGKPFMFAWDRLEVWEVLENGTSSSRVGL